jgi:uncharacterized membrane protein YqjE
VILANLSSDVTWFKGFRGLLLLGIAFILCGLAQLMDLWLLDDTPFAHRFRSASIATVVWYVVVGLFFMGLAFWKRKRS